LSERPTKTVDETRVTLSQLMEPQHANLLGNVHGGWIMKLVDEAGALAAMRHSQCRVVTVAIDQMQFHEPIRIGDLVSLDAALTFSGRTSMEARVEVNAENPLTGKRTHTNTAYLVYVALNEGGVPQRVPSLTVENDLQKRRMENARVRQKNRLEAREMEKRESQV
jgi:acyl-CoA hydrolase